MPLRGNGDAGQAFPIYITVVGGLLFLALAYFAVGQAAATRSEAQTAADAAALAAALETRDRLADQWLENVLEPDSWQDIFDGKAPVPSACWRAHELAARNDASVDCEPDGLLGYTVVAETNDTVGDTIVPGTEDQKATESATAVIEARCSPKLPAEDADDGAPPNLSCKGGEDWDLNPEDLSDLPKPEDLFDVHLADS
ncbi:pilus assembly protein TadG-related protein [Streptomyces lancefieldiae]|uniref:Pilus assembly protein TadG-related protein n=1 Tax=Streptomyces lancefieldiae TaxID=3075520 RepID=A0ABU3ARV9_9ACTN|nr:pilus assembly protein TadG-related protein [Streptomyces sp. DSM 40712]MDT0612927.1 pilus assembly protein TadG-related protein [Streptomyces sp. DSM 40712]